MVDSKEKDHFKHNKDHTSCGIESLDGRKLLYLARWAMRHYLEDGTDPVLGQAGDSTPPSSGLFVTLWTVNVPHQDSPSPDDWILRGCIGHMSSNLPLYESVQEVAISAATRDPRFPPLALSELKETRIEVSILSPLRPITKLQQINIGRDGLMIAGLGKRGLLLPKVATRMGWDQTSFLAGVCRKAGLSPNCWPESCNLHAFTTTTFADETTDQ